MKKMIGRKAASKQYRKHAKHDKRNFKIYKGGQVIV